MRLCAGLRLSARARLAVDRLQAHLAHQPPHLVPAGRIAFPLQMPAHLPGPVKRMRRVQLVHPPHPAHAPDPALDNCRVVVACLKHARPTLHCGDPLALRGRGDPAGAADAGWRDTSRSAFARQVCREFGFVNSRGQPPGWRAARRPCARVCTARDASICRPRAMAAAPVTAVRVGSASRSRHRKRVPPAAGAVAGLKLTLVTSPQQRRTWNELVASEHRAGSRAARRCPAALPD